MRNAGISLTLSVEEHSTASGSRQASLDEGGRPQLFVNQKIEAEHIAVVLLLRPFDLTPVSTPR